MNSYLVIFHIFILIKGYTTYEYISYFREKKEMYHKVKVSLYSINIYSKLGEINKRDYEKWMLEADPKNIRKKSKIIQEITNNIPSARVFKYDKRVNDEEERDNSD